MIAQNKKYSVLVVSSSDKTKEAFRKLLPPTSYSSVAYAGSIAAAKRAVLDKPFDFVIINTPLGDDFGTDFAIDFCTKSAGVCLMMVKAELIEKVSYKVTPYGVFTISKPVSGPNMELALRWMAPARERLIGMEKKTDSIEGKMKEIRIVNRAKWVLIDSLKMTEAEAHRYIEKQAMDKCIGKISVAQEILKTYQK